jgi:hypothetical protein
MWSGGTITQDDRGLHPCRCVSADALLDQTNDSGQPAFAGPAMHRGASATGLTTTRTTTPYATIRDSKALLARLK